MSKPIKKVAITVYIPAGDICKGATFRCPLLLDAYNTPSVYCLLIPESFWWMHERITKHSQCPSLFHVKANTLSEEDIVNRRLRLVRKSIKEHNLESLLNQVNDDE